MSLNRNKILNIVFDLNYGGTQRNAQNFSIGFKKKGFEVAVLSYLGGGQRQKELENEDIEVFVGGNSSEEIDNVIRKAVAWHPEVVFIHSQGRDQPEIYNIIKNIKASISERFPIIERNVFAIPSSYVNLVDVHWLLSHWDVWQWGCQTYRIYPRPICVAGSNISDTSQFYKVDNEDILRFRVLHKIPLDAFVFGRIGQPLILKWSPFIFSSFKKVAEKEKKAYLLLVGLPSELRSYLEGLSSEIRERIIEIPFIYNDKDLRICYGAMDVFIHVSEIGENCGNVLNESMLCECPVITLSTPYTNNSQVEQVVHNECGFVVARIQDYPEAMLMLMRDNLLRQSLGKEGRRAVLAKYSMGSVMNLLVRLIEIALASPNRESLGLRLQKENGFVTNVNTREILALYKNAFGKRSAIIRSLLKLRALKNRSVQRVWPRLARKAFIMGI